ncbi:MAG: DoxX family protein [Bdellovibrionia bacterium]
MTKLFSVKKHSLDMDVVLLIIRVITGLAFIQHGFGKIQNPFHWMGADAPVPAIFQALAALSEFGGGFALILGLLTRLGAFGITCTMIVAVYTHAAVMGDPFVNATGGRSYELAMIYLGVSLAVLIFTPGRFSADRAIFGSK